MLLGRRKPGFTEEEILRPEEIPDFVNEANDRTFRRSASSAAPAPEPAWTPPPPMPMHRLLREFIRDQSSAGQVTPESALTVQDPEAAALLQAIREDPACADVQSVAGEQDVYYYSRERMSRFIAWLTVLVNEDDLPRLLAEVTRHNCATFPAPTLAAYFTLTPFSYEETRIAAALSAMEKDARYSDIQRLSSEQGREYLYSTQTMDARYALALANDLDRSPTE